MARLHPGRERVTTAAGVPISGGKLRVYNAGTTTLTTLYTTSALSTPLANPVVADSDGWCAEIHAAEGTLVDYQMETAGGVVLKSFEDLEFLGSDTGTFSRDLTNSRFRVRDVAGVVYLEAGNATGDDVGGDMQLSGWAGTQLDTLDLDAATINSTTDTFTINSKKLSGVVTTTATTFSAVNTVDIPLTNTPSGTRAWEVTIFDLISTTATGTSNLRARFSYDGGANYKAGVADYSWSGMGQIGATADPRADEADGWINLAVSFFTPANKPGMIKMQIITPDSGNYATRLHALVSGYDNAATPVVTQNTAVGFGLGSYGRATHVRLILEIGTGTMTGKYVVEALRGYGE